MAKPTGFLEYSRETPKRRPVDQRVHDWLEVYEEFPLEKLKTQAARCMDCGIPFCHQGCPLGNIIPDWNDLVYRDRWRDAIDRLHATNNFPEFTGRLCPAPCEAACVLGINNDPVTIKQVELEIIEYAWQAGWVKPQPATHRTGKTVAVIGSGPAGLACAQQLARAGHEVTVFERDDRIGGLLRYGIPDFKMEKRFLDRRLAQMEAEGVVFRAGVNVGKDIDARELLEEFDAICLAGGATQPRDLQVPGRELKGVYFAMQYLPMQNRRNAGDEIPEDEFISAKDKRVIILGGGDTGADCLGTALRQGAREVLQYEILPKPPASRPPEQPWPLYPNIYRVSSAHEEGGTRDYCIMTTRLSGENGRLTTLHAVRVEFVNEHGRQVMREIPGSEFSEPVDLLLLAMGFLGPEKGGLLEQLGVQLTERGNVWADENKMTSVPGVFTAGDMTRGQSLIVWAIAEGRAAARGIDQYLMGDTRLPIN
ncbi:glutamate synthase subunit beta [Tepidiforma sp.]|uniref:glutamate synthase subunit beta n=1 Tax=Tepidiforma sp. TaxID=2682230 RepID=UPI00261FD920|nr:glutamate synthase subunit beta [Tepidiforma sp.]MCX7616925.1 glutamate synthase subunit beta [Tepidiforma sp.]